MSTRFNKKIENDSSIIQGYEVSGSPAENIHIPPCGIEDLDRSVFNLFEKDMPLYYEINNDRKKVPVIFASGERYAINRRKKPITDKQGVVILPLISIGRASLDMSASASKLANNEMFPMTLKRIHKKSTAERIFSNPEGFKNVKNAGESPLVDFNPQINGNIIETIQLPPVKTFNAKYEIVIWSSFSKQINNFLETIMMSFTNNPGNQVKLTADNGYWFVGKFEGGTNQENNFTDFTDQERYIKQTFTISASGYIINPDIEGVSNIRSYESANNVSFDFYENYNETHPTQKGIKQSTINVIQDSDFEGSQIIGIDNLSNEQNFYKDDKSNSWTTAENFTGEMHDDVAGWSTEYRKQKKILVDDGEGNKVQVQAKVSSNGEIIYDQKYAELLFNVSKKIK